MRRARRIAMPRSRGSTHPVLPRDSLKDLFRLRDGTILSVEVCQRHVMDFLGRSQPATVVLASECETRVLDQIGLKSKIARHPDRRFERVVRDHPDYDERVDP